MSAAVPYWLDDAVDGWLIREVGDYRGANRLGWYVEDCVAPKDALRKIGPWGKWSTTVLVPDLVPPRVTLIILRSSSSFPGP